MRLYSIDRPQNAEGGGEGGGGWVDVCLWSGRFQLQKKVFCVCTNG